MSSFKSVAVRASIALIAVSTASLASAVTITQNFNYSTASTPWTANPGLLKFDSTLGTLTSVEMYIHASIDSTMWLANKSVSSENHIVGDVNATVSIRDASTSPASNLLTAGVEFTHGATFDANTSAGLPTYDGHQGQMYATDYASDAQSTSYNTATSMARFIGAGALNFRIRAVASSTTSDDTGNYQADYFTNASADGWIKYNYTPNAVPEPTSIAALGLGAVAMLRRRNRKA